jgi:two-component system, NarL family, nitrate/nitrite response regulator NarL
MESAATRQITVVVADGQPLFLDALARTVRQDARLRLTAEVGDARAAVQAIARVTPAVALIDVDVPPAGGRCVLDAVIRDRGPTAVVLLASHPRADAALEAMATGARGYLSKRASAAALGEAIRRVAAGDAVLDEEHQTLLSGELRRRWRDELQLLSPRELAVLELIAKGCSAPAIGRRLHLSAGTVKWYTAQIYERLGVHERAQAVAEAMRRGLLS